MKVAELLGWTEYVMNNFHVAATPYYGSGFASYKWVKVAETAARARVDSAGHVSPPYHWDSNRTNNGDHVLAV